ncbi:hypothetical protein BB559_001705 [Furculomyces boomerangus]|uniref:Ammonium transporter AmtB-like domain-containing protein n=1 Tax=Furculomyces boomerangus TaxID=61424 RepID=A0A2T9Z148_9FUNG|nr:hypothetical protein BB559_001705 [Furculomyces boomerangus]
MTLSIRQDQIQASAGDTAWVMIASALVFLMIPGIGFFYSGMSRSKSSLTLIILCVLSLSVVSIQWTLFGYSLSFSDTSKNPMIGNFRYALLLNVDDKLSNLAPTIPVIVFSSFQWQVHLIPSNIYLCFNSFKLTHSICAYSMFAGITPAITMGSVAERIRIIPCIIYFFIWTTFVYDPVAYWNWSEKGWLYKLGALDFAGGTVVHITSGFSALCFAHFVGKRKDYDVGETKPSNILNVAIGAVLIWFGWFGFNAGSSYAADTRAGYALYTTNISAAAGGMTMMMISYSRTQKLSLVQFCSGVVAGLVGITPAAGFVDFWAAIVIGIVTPATCYFASTLKHKMGVDDSLDVFALHGIGGTVGSVLTGIFASSSVVKHGSGTIIKGGWINRNWIQVPIQLLSCVSVIAWTIVVTFAILYIIDSTKIFKLRLEKSQELLGVDISEMGEYGYDLANIIESDQTSCVGSQLSVNGKIYELGKPNEHQSLEVDLSTKVEKQNNQN